MSRKWRRFEVMLPRQFNDGRDVPPEWISRAALEIGDHCGGCAMSLTAKRGISVQGLDTAFDAEEARCGNLILDARMLQAQGKGDEAASKFAEVAPLEDRLAELCQQQGLVEKAWVHRFDAVRAWALARNYLAAITAGDALLSQAALPEPLRQRIREYVQSLRERRMQLSEQLASPDLGNSGNGATTVMRNAPTAKP